MQGLSLFQAGDMVPLPHALDPALAVTFPPPPGTAARLPRRYDQMVVVDALDLTPAGVPASTTDPVVEVLPPLALILHIHNDMCLCRVFHPLHRVPRVYTFTHHVRIQAAALPCPPLYAPSLPSGALRYCTSFRLARLCRTHVSALTSSVAVPPPQHFDGAVPATADTVPVDWTKAQEPAAQQAPPSEYPRHVLSTSPIVPPPVSTQHAAMGVGAACPRSLQDARVLPRCKDLDETVVEPLLFAPPARSARSRSATSRPMKQGSREGRDAPKRQAKHYKYRVKQRKESTKA